MEVDLSRIRRPNGRWGWGWVDRRIVTDGHLIALSQTEAAVYLFLCVVADRQGVSWYGSRALARFIKHPPEQIREALLSLARRNMVALAGRYVQVLDLETAVPGPVDPGPEAVPGSGSSVALTVPVAISARERLAGLPAEQRDELLRRARQQMGRFLGQREPSQGVLEAVAVGLLGKEDGGAC